MTVIFKDLAVGDTFDWVSPDRMMNSFYLTCIKESPRSYRDEHGGLHKVGSIGASVYHVNELPDRFAGSAD